MLMDLGAGGARGASGTGFLALSALFLSSGFTLSLVTGGCLLVAIFLSLSGVCLRLRAQASSALRSNNPERGEIGAVGEH